MKKIPIIFCLLLLNACDIQTEKKELNNVVMKKELNKNNNQVTVLVQVSYTEDIEEIKKFIKEEQSPLFYDLNDPGIVRFEWFLNEDEKSATLIEVFKNSNVWEELGNKVLGSPINLRFRELFKIEQLTVLGDVNESFKKKIEPMNPLIKSYVGGIN